MYASLIPVPLYTLYPYYLLLQITKQGMSSRVIDEQNVEKQFTSSEIVSSAENLEMLPPAQPDDHEETWAHVSTVGYRGYSGVQ